MQMKEDDWDAVIDTNLTSIFRVSKAFQRGMQKARWGRCFTSYIFLIVMHHRGREVSLDPTGKQKCWFLRVFAACAVVI